MNITEVNFRKNYACVIRERLQLNMKNLHVLWEVLFSEKFPFFLFGLFGRRVKAEKLQGEEIELNSSDFGD